MHTFKLKELSDYVFKILTCSTCVSYISKYYFNKLAKTTRSLSLVEFKWGILL